MEEKLSREKLTIVAIIAVIAVVGVGVYFALGPKAEFEVTSLTLSPSEAKVGQTVTVSAVVKNTGDVAGTHRVALTIDGGEVGAEEVTLAVGETKTVTFTIVKDVEGTYTVGVGGLTKTLNVNLFTPATFEVSNLVINPSEVEVGKPVVISATVKNVGGVEGTYTAELKIDGATEVTKDVALAGGATKTVSFTVTKDTSGTYVVGVNGLQCTLSVLEPATFELTNLIISPTEVEPIATVTISVIVKNMGGLKGNYTVELKIDGVVEATKDVTLAGGESTTVIFAIQKEALKSYLVQVENLSQSFNVKPITELLSTLLYPAIQIGGYVHQLGFGLFNGSSQTITVTGAEFFDKDGNIEHNISEADIARIWGSGDVEPSESFSGYVSFQTPYSIEKINDWWVKWYCLDACGNRFTVQSFEVIESIEFPSPTLSARGLTWNGSYLWVAGYDYNESSQNIYKMDVDGNVIYSFSPSGAQPAGLTWDGEHLWKSDSNGKIYELDTNGNVLSSFTAPATYLPSGLAWDGSHLWHANEYMRKIYELDKHGNVISSFESPGSDPRGLAWDGSHLWVVDTPGYTVYKINTNGDIISSYGGLGFIDLTWDGHYFWGIEYQGNIRRFSSFTTQPNISWWDDERGQRVVNIVDNYVRESLLYIENEHWCFKDTEWHGTGINPYDMKDNIAQVEVTINYWNDPMSPKRWEYLIKVDLNSNEVVECIDMGRI